MNKYAVVLSIFCFLIAVQGCFFQKADTPFARDFYYATPHSNYSDMAKRMEHYSLEKQYEIYLFGMQVIHPPVFEFAEPIAKRGQEAVPFLIAKLTSADNDFEVINILHIIVEMMFLKSYDTKKDMKLIEAIKNRISKMDDPSWKRSALDDLKRIQGSM